MMNANREPSCQIQKIGFLGNYPLRKCCIATFTADILGAIAAERLDDVLDAIEL